MHSQHYIHLALTTTLSPLSSIAIETNKYTTTETTFKQKRIQVASLLLHSKDAVIIVITIIIKARI